MQGIASSRIIDVDLEGIIKFQDSHETVGCIVHDITEDYTEAMAFSSDPRICVREDIELKIILPSERSPIRCTGEIVWHSGTNEELIRSSGGYLVRILITHISRIDGRRLDLILTQKRLLARGPYLSP